MAMQPDRKKIYTRLSVSEGTVNRKENRISMVLPVFRISQTAAGICDLLWASRLRLNSVTLLRSLSRTLNMLSCSLF
jgi:hypothetical protein